MPCAGVAAVAVVPFSPPPPLPFPSLGAAPPDPRFGLNGLVLKRRTGWNTRTGTEKSASPAGARTIEIATHPLKRRTG